jgi:hypothetical protein
VIQIISWVANYNRQPAFLSSKRRNRYQGNAGAPGNAR